MPKEFKKLHEEWKKAKKDAKSIYDHWARLFTDVTRAHEQVTSTVPDFPKFDKDLGPSLDNLHKDKDVDKSLKKADTAIVQYKKDVTGLLNSIDQKAQSLPDDDSAGNKKLSPAKINAGFKEFVKALQKVLLEIEEAVEDRVKEHSKSLKKK